MIDLPIHEYTRKIMEAQSQRVESWLSKLGLTLSEVIERCYKSFETDGAIVYWIDHGPIMISWIELSGNVVTGHVESITLEEYNKRYHP